MMDASMGLSLSVAGRCLSTLCASLKAILPAGTVRWVTHMREAWRSYGERRVSDRLPIAVLVSGTGTNLQALLDTVHGREAKVVAVASSTAGAPALERAEQRGVPSAVFARAAYADRGARDAALVDWLLARGARLIVLAGYMELLGDYFLDCFPGAVINVHPSLLPAFPGLGAIEQALAYGVKV